MSFPPGFYAVVFLFGVTAGSFLNVCILRIPKGESIVTVPSHCVSCGKRLAWYELVPLFSWLFLRGRCSGCKAPISAQYPLIEAANGLLWVLVFLTRDLLPNVAGGGAAGAAGVDPLSLLRALLTCFLISALLVLAVIDARTMEIPAGVNWFILVIGLALAASDYTNLLNHAVGFFAVSLPLLLIYALSKGRAVGGGDVKLMAVCGLALGWERVLLALFLGCLIGSAVHLLRMKLSGAGRTLALGPYLAAGVALSLLFGGPAIAWYAGLFRLS